MPVLHGREDVNSFGYLHLPTGPDSSSPVSPAANRIEDVRDRLHDPAAAPDILDLDGFHPRVQDVVLNTPGARELLANLANYAGLPAGPSHIAIGCAGGRHRAIDRTTGEHAGRTHPWLSRWMFHNASWLPPANHWVLAFPRTLCVRRCPALGVSRL
ncbi:hypothetical protein [Streptomyces sp. NBC_01546]|uniref:RapZ C-terminal domain-containing protein n=1 Tax=Streptomyces sp. NBC_01546 TaxID=2975872 RepID=UPI00386E5C1D